MPAYNFKDRFAAAVATGKKKQTVRTRRRDGWTPKVGQPFTGYTRMRRQDCRKLVTSVITEVREVRINPAGFFVDGVKLTEEQAHELARLDGFSSANEMVGWFLETHGRYFFGHLIRWR